MVDFAVIERAMIDGNEWALVEEIRQGSPIAAGSPPYNHITQYVTINGLRVATLIASLGTCTRFVTEVPEDRMPAPITVMHPFTYTLLLDFSKHYKKLYSDISLLLMTRAIAQLPMGPNR